MFCLLILLWFTFVVEERAWNTWMDPTQASWPSTIISMWSYSYFWRTLCMYFSAPVCSLLSMSINLFILFWLSCVCGFAWPTALTSLIFFMQLLLFGGHGTGGWLSRYDVYYNDTIILDRGIFLLTCFIRSVSCSRIIKFFKATRISKVHLSNLQ